MNLDEMKKLYESGDYIIYALTGANTWIKVNELDCDDMQLIRKSHEVFADAYINRDCIRVRFSKNSGVGAFYHLDSHNFFSHYEKDESYVIDNASYERYLAEKDEPIQLSATNDLNDLDILGEDGMIKDNQIAKNTYESGHSDERIRTCNVYKTYNEAKSNLETLSITDEDGKVYEFEKPEFKCILKFKTDRWTVGTIANYNAPAIWDKYGRCLHQQVSDKSGNSKYNLTPIKPKWYEDKPKPWQLMGSDNKMVTYYGSNDDFNLCLTEQREGYSHFEMYSDIGYRLATKQERDSLHCEE